MKKFPSPCNGVDPNFHFHIGSKRANRTPLFTITNKLFEMCLHIETEKVSKLQHDKNIN